MSIPTSDPQQTLGQAFGVLVVTGFMALGFAQAGWPWALGVVAGFVGSQLVLGLLLGLASLGATSSREFSALDARLRKLEEATREASCRRPPSAPDAEPGAAADGGGR